MIVYHGSSRNGLKNLEYSEENSRFGGDANLLHGAGIYLTTSSSEAMAYATASLYKIKVTGYIFDTTDKEVLQDFVSSLFKSWGVDQRLVNNNEIQSLIRNTTKGESSGVGFGIGLFTVLSNEISLYSEILKGKFNDDIDSLDDAINTAFHYRLIKVKHKGNNTDWVVCLDHDGNGLEILEELNIN